MAQRPIKAGASSQTIYLFIQDSSSTVGAGLTGLVFNTSNLVAYYILSKAAAVAITLATQTVTGAYSSGGFVEVSSANVPGVYRLDLPDAAVASGEQVFVMLKGAANMAPCPTIINLTATNDQDAVRGGMTALPNAAAEAAGGLYTRGTGAGQINQDANGRIDANVKTWIGGTIPAVNVTGVPLVDAKYLLGTIFATPATAGIPDVNVKNMNNVAATSITTINANQGTTQPVNFTGTGASALAKSDMVDVAGAAVSTSTAQIGVNAVNLGGTAQTGRDIGASVLLSPGTGTGQLDFTSGVVKANLAQILGTALTETAGQIAAAFKKFFDIAAPAATMDHGILVDTITIYTGDTPQTGDSFARIGAAGAGLTALGDTRIANLDATVSSRLAPAGTLATVTNLTNAPTAGDFTATMKTSLNAATPAVTVSDKTGFSLSAAGVQAIWDALTSALTTVGSVGKRIADFLTGDAFVRIGAAGAGLTALGDTRIANLDATVSSRTKPADTQAAVTTVANLTNAPTAGDFTAVMKTSLNAATPAVTVSDKTGFSLTAPYDPAKTAAQAGDAMTLTAGERNAVADALLKRDWTGLTGEAARSMLNALRFLRNKWTLAGATLTVTKEDDTAVAWTGTVTTDAAALPVTGNDPT